MPSMMAYRSGALLWMVPFCGSVFAGRFFRAKLRWHRLNEPREHVAIFHAIALEVNERPTAVRFLIELKNVENRSVGQFLNNWEAHTGTAPKLKISADAHYKGPWHQWCCRS